MSQSNAERLDETQGFERRERMNHTINSLVRLRQRVVVAYCKLSGLRSFEHRHSDTPELQREELRSFVEELMDYTAMGHFEIYQRIIEGKERRKSVKAVAAEVYPSIAETTDFMVDFNDRYDAFDGSPEAIEQLQSDLSKLGEMIAVRGELEDRLLEALA